MGLLPIRLNRNKGKWSSMKTFTLGAMADSYYEYLLKMWLLKQQKVHLFTSRLCAVCSAYRCLQVCTVPLDLLVPKCAYQDGHNPCCVIPCAASSPMQHGVVRGRMPKGGCDHCLDHNAMPTFHTVQ